LIDAESRNARETVICEKSLASATSTMVGMARPRQSVRLAAAGREESVRVLDMA
jgi:hypothetical protein